MLGMKNSQRQIIFKAAWNLLNRAEKLKVLLVVIAQFALGLMDLIGVAAVAILGALSVRGVQSQKPGDTVNRILNIFRIENTTFKTQAIVVALFAALILISKTVLSVYLNRKINFFLSRRSARLSGDLIEKSFSTSILFLKSYSQQELLFALTAGVNALTIGVMAPSIALIADGSLLFIMTFGLFFVQPTLTFLSFLVFGLIALVLHKTLITRASNLGKLDTELNISSTSAIVELISTYRESTVQGSVPRQINAIRNYRENLARTSAEMSFMPNITKYVMEVTLIVSALLIGAFAFILSDAVHAVATLVLFLAAGFRIAPAILRIQQGLILVNSSIASATPTLEIAKQLENTPSQIVFPENGASSEQLNPVEICLNNVSYRYPGQDENLLNELNFTIKPGEAVAIVGPSGAGKTTLVDLILGVLAPTGGEIKLNGFRPSELSATHPGAIGYVPQNTFLIGGTLMDNVLLGLDTSMFEEADVRAALNKANLREYAEELPLNLAQTVGDAGIQLSGGQKQRLGLARAFLTNPKLLVLDEATSALDAETEAEINESLIKLKGKATLLVIAHRLATIRNMDRVVYIDKGRILAEGTFAEVREQVPDFDNQAKLMGL